MKGYSFAPAQFTSRIIFRKTSDFARDVIPLSVTVIHDRQWLSNREMSAELEMSFVDGFWQIFGNARGLNTDLHRGLIERQKNPFLELEKLY